MQATRIRSWESNPRPIWLAGSAGGAHQSCTGRCKSWLWRLPPHENEHGDCGTGTVDEPRCDVIAEPAERFDANVGAGLSGLTLSETDQEATRSTPGRRDSADCLRRSSQHPRHIRAVRRPATNSHDLHATTQIQTPALLINIQKCVFFQETKNERVQCGCQDLWEDERKPARR